MTINHPFKYPGRSKWPCVAAFTLVCALSGTSLCRADDEHPSRDAKSPADLDPDTARRYLAAREVLRRAEEEVAQAQRDADREEYLRRLQSRFSLPIHYQQISVEAS